MHDFNITIHLTTPENPDHIHTNGSTLCGHVKVISRTGNAIDHLSIHFRGEVKSSVAYSSGSSRIVRCANSFLFDFKQSLTHDTRFDEGSAWPFEFEFPWESLPTDHPVNFGPDSAYEDKPGFPLPPSFSSAVNEYSRGTFREPSGENAVSYYLEVVENDTTALLSGRIVTRLNVLFSPSRPVLTAPSPRLRPMKCSLYRCTKRLNPEYTAQKPSVSRTIRRLLIGSGSTPKPIAYFDINSTVPCQSCIGGSFPVSISIKHQKTQRKEAPLPPLVTFKKIECHLKSLTCARVPYAKNTQFGPRRQYTDTRTNRIQFQNRSFSILMDGNQDLSDILSGFVLPEQLLPSFKTYNLTRRYELKVKATFSCLDQAYEVYLTKGGGESEFTVVPMLCTLRIDYRAEEQRRTEEQTTQMRNEGSYRRLPLPDLQNEEWLPRYEEVATTHSVIEPQ